MRYFKIEGLKMDIALFKEDKNLFIYILYII